MKKKKKTNVEVFHLGTEPMRVREVVAYELGIEGTIDDVVAMLRDKEAEAATRGITQLKIDIEYYGYDGGHHHVLYGARDETPKEIEARIKKETARKKAYEDKKLAEDAKREAAELKELARLTKLYAKKTKK